MAQPTSANKTKNLSGASHRFYVGYLKKF